MPLDWFSLYYLALFCSISHQKAKFSFLYLTTKIFSLLPTKSVPNAIAFTIFCKRLFLSKCLQLFFVMLPTQSKCWSLVTALLVNLIFHSLKIDIKLICQNNVYQDLFKWLQLQQQSQGFSQPPIQPLPDFILCWIWFWEMFIVKSLGQREPLNNINDKILMMKIAHFL